MGGKSGSLNLRKIAAERLDGSGALGVGSEERERSRG